MKLFDTSHANMKYTVIQLKDKWSNGNAIVKFGHRLQADLAHYGLREVESTGPNIQNGWNEKRDVDIAVEEKLEANLKNMLIKAKSDWKASIVVVVPASRDAKVYATLKRIADIEVGIPTICVLPKTLTSNKNMDDLVANLALKCNVKLSNKHVNHTIDVLTKGNGRPKLLGKKTMIVGLDVVSRGGAMYLIKPLILDADPCRSKCHDEGTKRRCNGSESR